MNYELWTNEKVTPEQAFYKVFKGHKNIMTPNVIQYHKRGKWRYWYNER